MRRNSCSTMAATVPVLSICSTDARYRGGSRAHSSLPGGGTAAAAAPPAAAARAAAARNHAARQAGTRAPHLVDSGGPLVTHLPTPGGGVDLHQAAGKRLGGGGVVGICGARRRVDRLRRGAGRAWRAGGGSSRGGRQQLWGKGRASSRPPASLATPVPPQRGAASRPSLVPLVPAQNASPASAESPASLVGRPHPPTHPTPTPPHRQPRAPPSGLTSLGRVAG